MNLLWMFSIATFICMSFSLILLAFRDKKQRGASFGKKLLYSLYGIVVATILTSLVIVTWNGLLGIKQIIYHFLVST